MSFHRNPMLLLDIARAASRMEMCTPTMFDYLVRNGIKACVEGDAEEETFAKMCYRHTPDALCYTEACGCKIAFFGPFHRLCSEKQGRYTFCKPRRYAPHADHYDLTVKVNAVMLAGDKLCADHPVVRHAIYMLAGLPYDHDTVEAQRLEDVPRGLHPYALQAYARLRDLPYVEFSETFPVTPHRHLPARLRPEWMNRFRTYMEYENVVRP